MSAPLLVIRDLTKSFGALPVLRGLSLDIGAGEVVCVIGTSGSGKSTLLRCLNLLESSDAGEILFHGEDIAALGRSHGGRTGELARNRLRARIGMVFQSFNLWPHMDVLANVMEAPLKVRRLPRDRAEREARALLDKVGLADFATARPSRLSGGQQQRVAIARALAMEPELMLFDEPTSALDPELTGEVLAVMRLLAAEGKTMVCVTHEMGFARAVASRIVFIDEGRVVEDGPPAQLFDAPREARTRKFLARLA